MEGLSYQQLKNDQKYKLDLQARYLIFEEVTHKKGDLTTKSSIFHFVVKCLKENFNFFF